MKSRQFNEATSVSGTNSHASVAAQKGVLLLHSSNFMDLEAPSECLLTPKSLSYVYNQ